MKKLLLVVLAGFALSIPAHAFTYVDLDGGLSFPNNVSGGLNSPSFNLGAEINFGFENLQYGVFYQNYIYNPTVGSTFNCQFFGADVRLGIIPTPIFVDARAGGDVYTGGNVQFGFGVGLGWRFNLGPLTSLSPRVGYSYLPSGSGSSANVIDADLLLALGF